MLDNSTVPGIGEGNSLYNLDTAIGASVQSCCNACFFDITNCVSAYWYSYEGCVIMAPHESSFTGVGNATDTCTKGKIANLAYVMDTGADFRDTGDIAGPCGVEYQDL
jgi:hypothetical protein